MQKELSVIIPIYNEEESIHELVAEIRKHVSSLKKSYEIVFIDDGSTDNTLKILLDLEKKYKEIRIFSFRKNLGKSYALMCGFQKAQGKYIATLDADLQDDPSNIKSLLNTLEENNLDMITGWRKERQDPFFKKISSKVSNYFISRLFGLKIHDLNGGLKLYKDYVVHDIKLYGGMHRFIPIIVKEGGYKVGEKDVVHHSRKYGSSKYKYTKIITEIPDLFTLYFLTKYTNRPLHFFGRIGTAILIIGAGLLIYLSILHFQGYAIGKRPLLIFGVLFVIAGIQTIFTGLIADLIVHVNYKDDTEFPLRYSSKNKI